MSIKSSLKLQIQFALGKSKILTPLKVAQPFWPNKFVHTGFKKLPKLQ